MLKTYNVIQNLKLDLKNGALSPKIQAYSKFFYDFSVWGRVAFCVKIDKLQVYLHIFMIL